MGSYGYGIHMAVLCNLGGNLAPCVKRRNYLGGYLIQILEAPFEALPARTYIL